MTEQQEQRTVLGLGIIAVAMMAFLQGWALPQDVMMAVGILVLGGLLVLTFCLWVRASCRRGQGEERLVHLDAEPGRYT